MKSITLLDQANYSEWVVRNSLYWVDGDYTLNEKDGLWEVALYDEGQEKQLHRLLNDYRLRELSQLKNGSASKIVEIVVEQITSNK